MGYNRNAETQRRLKKKYVGRYTVPIYFDEEKGIWRRYYWASAQKAIVPILKRNQVAAFGAQMRFTKKKVNIIDTLIIGGN